MGEEREEQRVEAGEPACMTLAQQNEGIIEATRWASHAKPMQRSPCKRSPLPIMGSLRAGPFPADGCGSRT